MYISFNLGSIWFKIERNNPNICYTQYQKHGKFFHWIVKTSDLGSLNDIKSKQFHCHPTEQKKRMHQPFNWICAMGNYTVKTQTSQSIKSRYVVNLNKCFLPKVHKTMLKPLWHPIFVGTPSWHKLLYQT